MHPRIFDRTYDIERSACGFCGRCLFRGVLVAAIPSLGLWAVAYYAIRGASYYLGVLAGLLP